MSSEQPATSADRSRLTRSQQRVLLAIANGATLKSHRYLDGTKVYQLHALDGSAQSIERRTVEGLRDKGLIDSNKKFPAATYWLTVKGRQVAAALMEQKSDRIR